VSDPFATDLLPAAEYLARACATHHATAERLAFCGGRSRRHPKWISYRRSSREPEFSDTWYDFSQLQADAALVACGRHEYARAVDLAFRHLECHWDPQEGGYFGRGGVAGDWVGGPDKYADDNALAGLALVAAAQRAHAPAARARYRARALAVGRYLVDSPLWDDVFDGGFWWNTRRGDTVEGKPTQSNGLAAALFQRLAMLTGDRSWRDWAARTLAWIEEHLYDSSAALYRYSVRYDDPAARRGRVVDRRYFNYDQGILIEALIEPGADNAAGSVARATAIATALHSWFWDPDIGGYVLEAGVPQVFAVYGAWLTPSLLRLCRANGDGRWRRLAAANLAALEQRFHARADDGYSQRAWREGGGIRVDTERHTAVQAWMQYAQACLANPDELP
jgi:hypothetical protein